MKKILVAVALSGLSATSAFAADRAVKAPVYAKAPLVVPYNWTGFYLGANFGGGVGRSLTGIANPGGTFSNFTTYLPAAGAIGGGQLGYNWQTNMGILGPVAYGLEADVQGSAQKDSGCIGYCSPFTNFGAVFVAQKIDWFGTMRGRFGLVTGPVLSYVTGGFAYGHVNTGITLALVPFSNGETRGGYTLGGGVEASLGGNWTGKIEYLYLDLGTQTQVISTDYSLAAGSFGNPVTVSSRVRDNIFRGGVNYRFGGNSSYSEPVYNWSGLYIGANAGSVISRNRSSHAFVPDINQYTEVFSLVPGGFEGGLQIGYNWQSSAWVFGLEADIQGTSAKDDRTCISRCVGSFSMAYIQKVPYVGTARGRLGYSVGSTLFYATAGYAYGQTKTTIAEKTFIEQRTLSLKHNKGGYVVGGGIESPLSLFGLFGTGWTVKSEYLFVDLGHTEDTFVVLRGVFIGPGIDVPTTRTQEHISRVGINYHFNTPVAAKF